MITRMWEAKAAAGCGDALAEWAARTQLPSGVDGFLGGRAYVSLDGDRVVVVADWRDEAAVEAFAGSSWRSPEAAPAEAGGLVEGVPHAWHFTPLSTGAGTVHN